MRDEHSHQRYAGPVENDQSRTADPTADSVTRRAATSADVPSLARLIDGHPLFARYGLTAPRLARGLLAGMTAGDTVMVARTAGVPVGLAWSVPFGAFGHMPYLKLLVVDHRAVRQGVGGRLLGDYEQASFAAARYAFLLATVGNDAGLRFYKGRGYEVVGRINDHAHPGVDEWILRKPRPEVDGPR